jgi:multiple sugar transport system substrate-binding protein
LTIIIKNIKLVISICFVTTLLFAVVVCMFVATPSSAAPQKKGVILTGLFDNLGDPPRWYNFVLKPAIQEMRVKHPDLDIQLDYRPLPYQSVHSAFLRLIANKTSLDIIDPSWLGEFAQKGFLTDRVFHKVGDSCMIYIKYSYLLGHITIDCMLYTQLQI